MQICPKCGKKVLRVTTYKDGDKLYIHEQTIRKGPLPHVAITKFCLITPTKGDSHERPVKR